MPENEFTVFQKTKRRNLLLFLLTIVLAITIFALKEIKAKKELIYFPIDTKSLEEIIIHQTPAITLKKIDNSWFVIQGEPFPANKKAMQNIFDMLSSPLRDEYPLSEVSLKELSLQAPNLKVELNGESLSFGTLSPLEQMHYVLFKDKVYLASPFLQVRFSQTLKTFMKVSEENAEQIDETLHGEH